MICSLDQLVEKVLSCKKKQKIAVASAQDDNTISAIYRAVNEGFAEGILVGDLSSINETCRKKDIDPSRFSIIGTESDTEAARLAVHLAKTGDADIIMKGLVGTDIFLRAVIDKEKGLLIPGAALAYVGAVEIPSYHKLLFLTDLAVIPFPDMNQKIQMAEYSLEIARTFGIEKPKIALVGASEKVSPHFPNTADYAQMCKMAAEGKFGDCIMDGPLDLFLACDKHSPEIKGVRTPVNGDADILLFPSLESSNPFYKSLMLFAGGEIAGLIRGTTKPVIVMSRSESEKSKYYCIAMSCLMAQN
ncbi:MAG TPA: phosphate acyltransferase [Bacteroidales bacterium]|nr:phosphate acyltransferase [Bacteroidales bacterium]